MTIATDPQYEKPATQHLDVVMLKRDVSEFAAKLGDFKRISVQAENSVAARWLPEVVKHEKEYRVLAVLPPGHQAEAEMLANQREYAGNVTDRSKVGL